MHLYKRREGKNWVANEYTANDKQDNRFRTMTPPCYFSVGVEMFTQEFNHFWISAWRRFQVGMYRLGSNDRRTWIVQKTMKELQ